MDKKIYRIKNKEGFKFSIQETFPESFDKEGEHGTGMELAFLVEGISRRDLAKGGDLALTMDKTEAFCLAMKIMLLCDNELCYVMDDKLIKLSCGIDKVEINVGKALGSCKQQGKNRKGGTI